MFWDCMPIVEEYRRSLTVEGRRHLAGQLCGNLIPYLRPFLLGKVDLSVVDDVLQETLIGIVKNLLTFRGKTEDEFQSWCRGVARKKVFDQHRKKYSARYELFPGEDLYELIEEAQALPHGLDFSESVQMELKEALDLLSKSEPECRELLYEHYIGGCKYAEIADDLNLSANAVRMRINRCLEEAVRLFKNF